MILFTVKVCCTKMEEENTRFGVYHRYDEPDINRICVEIRGGIVGVFDEVHYCPFCGRKLEIEKVTRH